MSFYWIAWWIHCLWNGPQDWGVTKPISSIQMKHHVNENKHKSFVNTDMNNSDRKWMITINRNQTITQGIGCYLENIIVHSYILRGIHSACAPQSSLMFKQCLPNCYLNKLRLFPIFESKYKYFLLKNSSIISVHVLGFLVTNVVFVEMFATNNPSHGPVNMVVADDAGRILVPMYCDSATYRQFEPQICIYILFILSHVCNEKVNQYLHYDHWATITSIITCGTSICNNCKHLS